MLIRTTRAIGIIGIALFGAHADAGLISPISATTSDPILFGDLGNLIDGLIDFDSNVGIGNTTSGEFSGPYSIVFDLGGVFDLTAMHLWNNAGSIELDGEGIDGFELRFFGYADTLMGMYSGNAMDVLGEQSFEFDVQGIRSVEMVIQSNHAPLVRDYAALYEVAFVPSAGVLGVIGAGMIGISRRRR